MCPRSAQKSLFRRQLHVLAPFSNKSCAYRAERPEDIILKTVKSLAPFFEIEVGPTERAEGIIQTVVHFSTFANQKLRPWSAQKACLYRQLYVLASFAKKKLVHQALLIILRIGKMMVCLVIAFEFCTTHFHVRIRDCEVYLQIPRTLMIPGAPTHRIEITWSRSSK